MRVVLTVLSVLLIACSDTAQGSAAHPANLVGRWVRWREDQTWGDTMEFRPDGTLRGSTGYPIPPTLTWEVKRAANGDMQYCASQANTGFCRNYHFSGDTLFMVGGPRGDTKFRRVR
jgi:hypothetical protein